jgi:CheY-like chemotaxis protein
VLGAGAIATVAGLGYRFTLAPESGDKSAARTPQPAVAIEALVPAAGATSASSARVLVADDNKVNRLLLCRSLELMGHRVSSAENGRQALDMLRQHRYGLLLLDIAMPEMDGFELLRLRAGDAALREVAVIVTSAIGGVDPVARCIELGADDFLHKPVDPVLLRARVESSLARKQDRDRQAEALRRLLPQGKLQAQHRVGVTVLVARVSPPDLSAVTPLEALQLATSWSTLMLDALAGCGGELVQFQGDGLMALFDDTGVAVQAARGMTEMTSLLNAERRHLGQPVCVVGVGLARGDVVVGVVDLAQRSASACIGSPALRAEHLSLASARDGQAMLVDALACAALPAGCCEGACHESSDLLAYRVR